MQQLGAKLEIKNNTNRYQEYSGEYRENVEKLIQYFNSLKETGTVQYSDAQFLLNGFYAHDLTYRKSNGEELECSLPNTLHLYGTQENQLLDQANQKIEIISGRSFTKDEVKNGEKVILISDNFLMDGNKIQIYDCIPVEKILYDSQFNVIYQEVSYYTVIGIFKKQEIIDDYNTYDSRNYDARIYTPYTTIINEYEQFQSLSELYPQSINTVTLSLEKIEIKMADMNDVNRYYDILDYYPVLKSHFQVITTQSIYEQIATPLDLLLDLAGILSYLTNIAMIALLSVTLFIFLKDRRYEIGIIYSMGLSKSRIIIQYILEIFVICFLAITISMGSGQQIGKTIANQMIDNQLEASKYVYIEDLSQEDLLRNYETKFDITFIGKVYANIIVVVIFTSALPIIYILRLTPKKILL
ncbi:FtsX-like permease family protein [Traorella massiliensis]|uniref:FtsX-like permease family protein n=1 Tax=Traorella massiliensis TaxID=1903263 RepID=UPI00137A3155|nr:ABC transporter permease [Traorella massiliensis]